MVLCIQNGDFSTRIAGLYECQPLSVVFACKTASFGTELQVSTGPSHHLWFCPFKTAPLASEILVSMGPSPHLWFWAFTTATLWPELLVSMGPRLHLSFCACKTLWLATELLVSLGPRPHLLFLQAKQGLLEQNYKSLRVPAFACWLVNQNSVLRSRMTLVYWSQLSSVVLCIQNSDFSFRISSLYGSQPSSVVFACKTATLGPE